MYFLFLGCCGIVLKILENFTSPAIDIKKLVPSQKEKKVSSSWKSWAIPGPKVVVGIFIMKVFRVGFLLDEFEKI